MKCQNCVCGFTTDGQSVAWFGSGKEPERKEFIEIRGFERAPFITEMYSLDFHGNRVPYSVNSHLSATAIERGKPISAWTCPDCGSIQFKTSDLS